MDTSLTSCLFEYATDAIGLRVKNEAILTLFYTRGLEIVVLHVMVPQPYRFSPYFFT
jgi:hypothetical protein